MAATNITIKSFKQTLASAGTRQHIQTDTTIVADGFVVKALKSNTGIIYIGDVTVAAANGYELDPGEAVGVDAVSLQNAYFDGTVNSDKICVLWTGN